VRRIVAIGDLHGDVDAARDALRTAGAIDDRAHWVGGDLVVVQTGDVLDRGDSEHALLDLLVDLEPQARAAGGALVMLLGNHELMNAAGDFRYVTAAGAHAFDDVPGVGPKRKKALLLHFGSAKAVARAGLVDLETAPGVSKSVAKKVYDHFHGPG